MEEDRKKLTEKKLLSCGKREFLEKGYAKANLRSICEASGVTTGCLLLFFCEQEALLRAILDPFIADSRELLSGLARMEEEHPETATTMRPDHPVSLRTPRGMYYPDGEIRRQLL